ncbi:carbohydrate binding domain-containing protein [Hymenobacter armeniacus]|uniref:CBM-cenC domain-containing protein n=1 Tax=Hymenobacter armeniacus TaxID=2771358 RepID=A0ABR8JZI7_9BACT|nr:hypothetical protein [Hymenobacter armeniacus]MBD2723434.1 hypothetical protein [Hymenobacter armeniacus]
MKNFTLLLSIALLSACSSDDKAASAQDGSIVIENDFESLVGWNTDPAALFRGKAHSGRYALKVDKDHEFSPTFDMALNYVSPKRVKSIHLEAWAMLPGEKSTGVLGIQVMEPETGKEIYGGGIRLAESVKKGNQWQKVEADYELPATITPTQHLRLALWRADASDQVMVDDVKMTIK